jgi:hypothetical protein
MQRCANIRTTKETGFERDLPPAVKKGKAKMYIQ